LPTVNIPQTDFVKSHQLTVGPLPCDCTTLKVIFGNATLASVDAAILAQYSPINCTQINNQGHTLVLFCRRLSSARLMLAVRRTLMMAAAATKPDPIVQHVVVRADLINDMGWPVGAVMSQGS
jgi:hypothetical protein